MSQQTLIERYRPKSWEDLILPESIKTTLANIQKSKPYRLLLYSSPGTGKCLGLNTPVLMYDGSIKMVQDVVEGDMLMGWDSTPRTVLSTTKGNAPLYKITPNRYGDSFVTNGDHLLSLIMTGREIKDSNIFELTVDYLMNLKNTDKKYPKEGEVINGIYMSGRYKIFHANQLLFDKKDVSIDPYFLGLWLGDGTSINTGITVGYEDYEVQKEWLLLYADSIDCTLSDKYNEAKNAYNLSIKNTPSYGCQQDGNRSWLKDQLRKYNLIRNKHIPHDYLTNDVDTRRKLLAGLIDSDGFTQDSGIGIISKYKILADNISYLARGLGFSVTNTIKTVNDVIYYRVNITGDYDNFLSLNLRLVRKIPRKRIINKNHLVTGFKIEPIGLGDYYGFEIDGDKRFLLGDLTVTHNTSTARLIASDDNKLYLSGSNDFNIEVMRNKITPFASGASVTGKQKTIIIDEAENIRDALQDEFKVILDQARNTNFIFITNEVEKMNPALRSRCTNIEYNFINQNLTEHKKLYAKWLVDICNSIQKDYSIVIEKPAIQELFKIHFPDFRQILVVLQQLIDSGCTNVTIEEVKATGGNAQQLVELYDLIQNPSIGGDTFYSQICLYRGNEKETLISLGEPFFKYLNDKGLHNKTLEVAVTVSKYSDSYVTSINKFVTLLSCVSELRTLFR